jgi:hypothetical protein
MLEVIKGRAEAPYVDVPWIYSTCVDLGLLARANRRRPADSLSVSI